MNITNNEAIEINPEDLNEISGGSMRTAPYYEMVRRVWNAEIRQKTKAKCPICGAPFSAVTSDEDVTDEDLQLSQHGRFGWILCRSCNSSSNSEAWF